MATKKNPNRRGKGIVMEPQDIVKDAAWYYENKGSIDLICYPKRLPSVKGGPVRSRYNEIDGVLCLRIPSRLLRATMERQSYSTRKPK